MKPRKLLIILLMMCIVWIMLPAAAMAAGLEGLFLRSLNEKNEHGIYFNVTGMTPNEEHTINVDLYSGDKLLQSKGLTRKANASGVLGGTFYTVGVSSSWSYTPWTAWDAVVPTHAVVSVDGGEPASAKVGFTAEEWKAFPGTHENASLEGLYLRTVEKNNESGVYFNVINLPLDVESKIQVELYSGGRLLQQKTITRKPNSSGKLGGTFYTVGVSSSWGYTPWTAYDHIVPTHAVVYVDGVRMDSVNVAFGAAEWIPFAGTLPMPETASSVPQTGDNMPIAAAVILMVASLGAVVLLKRRSA